MSETVVNLSDRDIPETDKVPGMQHVLTLVVTVDELVEVGESDKGIRKYVPITGGYFAGQHVNGESLSGDATTASPYEVSALLQQVSLLLLFFALAP